MGLGLGGKTIDFFCAAIFSGVSLALWSGFGDSVYAADLSGALMNCFWFSAAMLPNHAISRLPLLPMPATAGACLPMLQKYVLTNF